MLPQTCHDHVKFKGIVSYQKGVFIFFILLIIYFLGIKHTWKQWQSQDFNLGGGKVEKQC